MSTGWVIGIIVVAISIILSNIMLLKKTAHHKMPSLKDLEKKQASEDGASQSPPETSTVTPTEDDNKL